MSKKVAHFYVYGVIAEDDALLNILSGDSEPIISSKSVVNFINENAAADELVIHINSPGGLVSEGFAIHDILVNSGKEITTIGEGQVSSIATAVFLSGSKRILTENSRLMIHNPWLKPDDKGLTADELQKMATGMKAEEKRIVDFYVKKTGANRKTIVDMMKEEAAFDIDKALELKFVTDTAVPVKALAFINTVKPTNQNEMTKIKNSIKKTEDKVDELLNIVKKGKKGKAADAKAEGDGAAAEGAAAGENDDEGAKDEAYTTDAGDTLNIDGGLVVGSDVTDADGNETPDASYTLEDGTMIETDADSKISKITPPAAAAAKNKKKKAAVPAELQAAIDAAVAKAVTPLNKKIEDLEEENEEYQTTHAAINKKLDTLGKSIGSSFNVKTGQTNLEGNKGATGKKDGEVLNKVEEGKKRMEERKKAQK